MAALYLDTGEPDAATSGTSGSEGGGWKSAWLRQVTRWPPTLLDGIFFLDLPSREEKDAIWNIYLGLYEIDRDQRMPDDTDWTGAEVKACCRLSALLDVPLLQAAQNVVPVAVTAAESVEQLRSWASGRCLSANQPGVYRHRGSTKPGSRRRVNRDPSNN